MKNRTYVAPWEHSPIAKILNRRDTIAYVGGERILQILEVEYHLKPFEKRHKMTLYWREDIDKVLLYFKSGIHIESEEPIAIGVS